MRPNSDRKTEQDANETAEATEVNARLLRAHPLPHPGEGDKESRGRVLIVGGAPEMPGAAILAAVAALRAGAGKLQIATCRGVAPWVGAAVPESLTVGLEETGKGGIAASNAARVAEMANKADAVLFGPGMVDEEGTASFLLAVIPLLEKPAIVLDAEALAFLSDAPQALAGLEGRAVLTPHAGEMARMLGAEKEAVEADAPGTARKAAGRFGAVAALKGSETFIAGPGGELYRNRAGNVGLATSGSGDTLAGVVAGLAARGTEPLWAAVWGVHLHALAGDRLAARVGALGFLARELLPEVPVVMNDLSKDPGPGKISMLS